ncbi:MAG: metal-sensitive transcriptional regulator [Clostridia bacterium]|nr:metal-sensitive transcriptional regulator [Clostridia bacterium]
MSQKRNHCEDKDECCTASENKQTARSLKLRQSLISRLNRIEGQVRGIKGMIEKDTYCDDILHQISAVQSAMKSVSRLVLENHMRNCLIERVQSGETEIVDELLDTIEKML